MEIVWLSWKDISHPNAGGAEVISDSILSRLAAQGHCVTLLTARYPGSPKSEQINGYNILRDGGRLGCYPKALLNYLRHHARTADLLIEEINTVPFFSLLFRKTRRILLFHQLCKRVWFFQMPLPVAVIGYLAEAVYLRLLSGEKTMAMSDSTADDLRRHGFKRIAPTLIEGVTSQPAEGYSYRFHGGRVLSFGSIRPMKQTLHQVIAFEKAADQNDSITLTVAGKGDGKYFRKVIEHMKTSRHANRMNYISEVSNETKQTLFASCDVLLMSSVKEGWGLTVTEAAQQGTPSIVYDVDGLKDSVQHQVTGLICETNSPAGMSKAILQFFGSITIDRATLATNALEQSRIHTVDNTHLSFLRALQHFGYIDNV